ncbi:MAG: phosphoribosylaminoimidazolesuccinocarboxamide synthase [Planctomycetota bacterium]|nr:phosphoribosylaminoimidazolesuccinocarboxamide synthase [Planctomycetota bacterium]
MTTRVVTTTDLDGLELTKRGKVRDLYDLGDSLLIVATDRISAFDVVFEQGIPRKGEVLTALSIFWFEFLEEIAPNHLIATDIDRMPPEVQRHREVLRGRSLQVKKATVLPVEWVARGYIAGSGWKDYQRTGAVCGIPLPSDLRLSSRLSETIFTPATKAESGHDENIDYDQVVSIVGEEPARELKEKTIRIYEVARDFLQERGIILCDTKLEWGWEDGRPMLIDEVLTPDSSRFWAASRYEEGRAQDSMDKQFVRDFLEKSDWDKTPPPPTLPPEVVQGTTERYLDVYKQITGKELTG